MSSVEVSEIKMKIGGREILLTLAEVKELQKILNDTFGKDLEPSLAWVLVTPIVIERPVIPRQDWALQEFTITCDSNTFPHQTNANGEMIVAGPASAVSFDVELEGEVE